jgi:glutamate synthase (NADPH/NADH) large chain
MFLVDIEAGRIIEDDEIKDSLADSAPYGKWLEDGMMKLSDLPSREHIVYPHSSVVRRQRAFGYTEEDLRILLDSNYENISLALELRGLGYLIFVLFSGYLYDTA